MAYRDDKDLHFLGEMESEDLNFLVEILTLDKDNKKRYTESLTNKEEYKKYSPNHHKYWKDIAEEIQYFGANSIISFFRRTGVLYREVAEDVADKLKVKYDKDFSIKDIEKDVILKIFNQSLNKMNDLERKTVVKEMGLDTSVFTPSAIISSVQLLFKAGGFQSYKITLFIADTILKAILGRGITVAGSALFTQSMAILTGPIGLALSGVFTISELAGPAYRVTIPTVIQIAVLRANYEAKKQKLYEEFMMELHKSS